MRYDSALIKYMANAAVLIMNIIFLGNIFYAPSAAIEAVSGFPSWLSIILCSTVSIIYTCVGGFKAVVWTDVFQATLILLGLLAVSIQGLIVIGGFDEVWSTLGEWNRLNFFDFDPDPTKRMNFYGAFFGNALTYMGIYGHLQVGMQRYCSMPTKTKAQLCIAGVIPGNLIITTLSTFTGMVTFAYYAKLGCDPKEAGFIRSYNQIVPYFVADTLKIPGLPGIFLASLTAATLSSASSSMNSCAAQIWAEIIKPKYPHTPERRAATYNKIIVLALGSISVGVALLFDSFKGTMIQVVSTAVSCFAGPNSALFIMAAFIPFVNWQGATLGSMVGFSFTAWIAVGSIFTPKSWEALPVPDNCPLDTYGHENSTMLHFTTPMIHEMTMSSTVSSMTEPEGLSRLYSLSFLWMKEVGTAVTIVVSVCLSFLFGYTKPSTVPYNLVHPLVRRFVKLSKNSVGKKHEAKHVPLTEIPFDKSVYYYADSDEDGSTVEL